VLADDDALAARRMSEGDNRAFVGTRALSSLAPASAAAGAAAFPCLDLTDGPCDASTLDGPAIAGGSVCVCDAETISSRTAYAAASGPGAHLFWAAGKETGG
jgi:hypothetical protein